MFFTYKSKVPFIACNHIEYPLICDSIKYDNSISQIKDLFQQWVNMEITYLSTGTTLEVSHPVIALSRIPIRSMTYNDMEGLFNLKTILNSVEFSGTNVANRFLDTIQLIQLTIPIDVQFTITGKFLYAMTQGVVVDTDGNMTGDLSEWAYVLREYPWIPYLTIYQSLLSTDLMLNKLGRYLIGGFTVNTMATS